MWMMEKKKPMKFSEVLAAGYEFPEAIDSATQSLIVDWFKYRRISLYDKDKWIDMFNRNLLYNYPYYQAMLRIDPTVMDVDWFVESYLEREVKHTGFTYNNNTTNNTQGTESARTTTVTDSKSTVNETNDDGTVKGNNSSSNDFNEFNRDEEYTRSQAHQRSNPMSASYSDSALTANNEARLAMHDPVNNSTAESREYRKYFASPKLKNPSASSDQVNNAGGLHRHETSSKDKTNSTGEHHNKVTSTGTESSNHSNIEAGNVTVNGITSATGSTQDNGTDRVIEAGRHQIPSEVINKARTCIANSRTWSEFRFKLDRSFYMLYDDEEEV